ncbi:hypothetical protein F66182_6885 [Fusarium sp. NRRL 66182]|nr:hypothetical protein F66182_6885 [Fusarium sp. NRRL 66182]
MQQSRAGQSSSSEKPDKAASSTLRVIFENPQLPRPPAEPSLELPGCFTSLVKDLLQEEGQVRRRKEQGLDDARRLRLKLARLKRIDLVRDRYQSITLEHWEKIIVMAAAMVDNYLGNEILATSTITNLNRGKLAYHTILKDMKVVREMIKLTDHLYVHWKHEFAFEVPMLLDTPISTLRLQSATKYDEFKRLLQQFLFIRPKYSLSDIQAALQTSLFGKSDWNVFWGAAALEYDPIRDNWAPKQQGNYPATVRIQIFGFKTFETSLDLQQKAAHASKSQVGCTRTNPSISAYDWNESIHGPVMQQVVQDLVGYRPQTTESD